MQEETNSEPASHDIIGESPALKDLLALARRVAASDATVLIVGEPGSGKELIARAIHRVSMRREHSFIKVRLSVAPEHLEGILFGQEKDALPGVTEPKIGRLQLANPGTLFLDEVAYLPLDLQPKLLRVLQKGELERQGGTRTIRVNVRVIASTNVDLEQKVAERRFRSDLYDHLSLTSVRVPSLCERRDDIPLLVRYFMHLFARRMNKQIEAVGKETMNALLARNWPGNVRELEDFIERAVALTKGSTLRLPVTESAAESESEAV